MNRPVFGLCVLIVSALLAVVARGMILNRNADRFASATDDIMATPVTVIAPQQVAAEAADVVFTIFRQVDGVMSEWKPDSPLSAVNRAAGNHPVEVPSELREIIRRGIEIGELTDGAFDITWAALWGLWDFKAEDPRLPAEDEVRQRVHLVDYRRIVIDDEAGTVYLPEPAMLIGLGGIAKGYALDRAADALRSRGIDSFLISAGGQVLVSGQRGNRSWRTGVRDPRGSIDDYFAHIELTDTSVASSGDYERFFILEGVRYHHILDPHTGMPARGLRSASVISADATLADALATALMVFGPTRAIEFVEQLNDVEALLIDSEGRMHVSSGLTGQVHVRHAPAP